MPNIASATLLLCAAIASPLSAQMVAATGPSASRIRLISRHSDTRTLTGTAVFVGLDTIRLVIKGATDTIAVATSTLRRVEQVRGRRSNVDRGAVIGAITLGIAGAIAAPLITEAMGDGPSQTDEMEVIGIGLLGGGISGAIIGAGIGALSTRDRWSAHPSFVARVVPTPTGMDLGLAMRLGF
jgi:hypothetical protein